MASSEDFHVRSVEVAGRSSSSPLPGWPAIERGSLEFSVSLRQHGTHLHLVREMSCGDKTVAALVAWNRDYQEEEPAAEAYDALAGRQIDLVLWSVGAQAIGEGWLDPLVDDAVATFVRLRDAERAREAALAEKAARKAEEDAIAAKELSFYVDERKGLFFLDLHRAGLKTPPLWSIGFSERWERERFWDWLGQQEERFEEFATTASGAGRSDLERRLLHEMLQTENAVKKQGLGAGGRRPLRFWRGDQS